MSKKNFTTYICAPYCMFFKEGEKEEMLCHGAFIVEQLIKNGQINHEKMQSQRYEKNSTLWIKHNEYLRTYVCQSCAFRTDGCDFYAEGFAEDIEPCGGFILLSYLRENNIFNDSDLKIALHE